MRFDQLTLFARNVRHFAPNYVWWENRARTLDRSVDRRNVQTAFATTFGLHLLSFFFLASFGALLGVATRVSAEDAGEASSQLDSTAAQLGARGSTGRLETNKSLSPLRFSPWTTTLLFWPLLGEPRARPVEPHADGGALAVAFVAICTAGVSSVRQAETIRIRIALILTLTFCLLWFATLSNSRTLSAMVVK